MKYVIGVDGGGTKTRGILAAGNGEIVVEDIVGATNQHSVGFDTAKKNLFGLFDSLMDQISVSDSDVVGICIGLAGIDREEDAELFRKHIEERFSSAEVRAFNDSFIGLYGGCHQPYGLIVISGTGSVIYGRSKSGLEARAGGWGHILGDEGSGYDIGRSALVAVCNAYDGRIEPTKLTDLILDKLKLKSPEDLLSWILEINADKSEVADLSRIVHEAYKEGDYKAVEILNGAADELAKGVKAVATRIKIIGDEYNLVAAGGNLKYQKEFSQLLTEKVHKFYPQCNVIYPKDTPVKGAMRYILKECGFQ